MLARASEERKRTREHLPFRSVRMGREPPHGSSGSVTDVASHHPCSSNAPAILSGTSSPTAGTYSLIPNSLRLTVPVASKPTV